MDKLVPIEKELKKIRVEPDEMRAQRVEDGTKLESTLA